MLARECSLTCERAGWNERRMARENCLVEFHLYLSYGTWTFRVQPARGYQILSARIRVPSLDTSMLENIPSLGCTKYIVIRINKIEASSSSSYSQTIIKFRIRWIFKISPIQRYLVEESKLLLFTVIQHVSS